MWKFILGKGQQPLDDRQKLQKELFAYRKTIQHGFPHKPSALAYDPKDRLMAIGTHSGTIKVFGRPGVEFYGQHATATNNATDCAVQLLEWVPGTGRILSLTTSNQLVLWEPAGAVLVPIKTLPFDGKLKKVSSLCCSYEKDIVWIGTEGGNVYQFDLKSFSIKEPVIYHDVVLQQVPQTYKLNPGAIESVKQLPNNFNHLLIVYNRGLCVLWDLEDNSVIRSYIAPGHGQSVGINVGQDGEQFTWYHADGSYATWDVNSSEIPENQDYVPYGPDPCKSITRLVRGLRADNELVVFSGGMPRSAYGEHQCVSIHCGDDTKICLDFTSKVIDFFVTFNKENIHQAEVLIVLLEEELCAYDLTDSALPPILIPYLHSVHASAVTCNHLVSQVTADVYKKIVAAGEHQYEEYSNFEWPVNGGFLRDSNKPEVKEYEILLTGHEDGSVRFWNCTGVVLQPILHFKTSTLFRNADQDGDEHPTDTEPLDDSEPPFRKSGIFDPYSDDPRLAVKKLALCPKTGQLIVAGTAGHIVIASLDHRIAEGSMKVTTMNLVGDRDGFVWKGHDQLKVKAQLLDEEVPPIEDGVQIIGVVQVLPPAAITCLALQTTWNLVSAGTAHGLILYDYFNHHPVLQKCTLNPTDLTGAGEALSRRKSFKKTLRESFRRLRKGRSTRTNPTTGAVVPTPTTIETRPIERQVEARSIDDGMGSMVRCLTFAQTYLIQNNSSVFPTLWAATNSSCVLVYKLTIPPKPTPDQTNPNQRVMIEAKEAKTIHLKHRAPVVGIAVVDSAGIPLDFGGPGTAPHRVLIASEEQFKVFSLPQLKPVTKYKLTAHEGARVRRMSFASFSCLVPLQPVRISPSKQKNENRAIEAAPPVNNDGTGDTNQPPMHTEIGLLCLTNLGDCLVLSIPELKRQINAAAVRREDINGISSLCFTNFGEALYMMSSSELQRISLSATKMVSAEGSIELDPLLDDETVAVTTVNDDDDDDDENEAETDANTPIVQKRSDLEIISEEDTKPSLSISIDNAVNNQIVEGLTNGIDKSPTSSNNISNKGNETISSSVGDITVDSVRDHLNSTVTTIHTTTTDEIIGRLSVLSTQTNNTTTAIKMKDITDNIHSSNFKDLTPLGDTKETSTSSVVIKSVITSMTHGAHNGEPETISTRTTTRKESQF